MTKQNYQKTITVSASPEDVYRALTTGFEHWWTAPDKPIRQEGDISKFSFSDRHGHWTFKATQLSPERIEMICIDARHVHAGQPPKIETEWFDTRIIWQIAPQSDKTTIHFEHDGLTPNLHCYAICGAGWDLFFVDSLKSYLDTGLGKPFKAD